jgi:hypothetical protein
LYAQELAKQKRGQRMSLAQIRSTLADVAQLEVSNVRNFARYDQYFFNTNLAQSELLEAINELASDAVLQYIERTQIVSFRVHS